MGGAAVGGRQAITGNRKQQRGKAGGGKGRNERLMEDQGRRGRRRERVEEPQRWPKGRLQGDPREQESAGQEEAIGAEQDQGRGGSRGRQGAGGAPRQSAR